MKFIIEQIRAAVWLQSLFKFFIWVIGLSVIMVVFQSEVLIKIYLILGLSYMIYITQDKIGTAIYNIKAKMSRNCRLDPVDYYKSIEVLLSVIFLIVCVLTFIIDKNADLFLLSMVMAYLYFLIKRLFVEY